MPSACAAAVALYGSSRSQGKAGSRPETGAGTGSAHFLMRYAAVPHGAAGPAGSPCGTTDTRIAVRRRDGGPTAAPRLPAHASVTRRGSAAAARR